MSKIVKQTLNDIRSELESFSHQLTKFHGNQQKTRYSPRGLVVSLLSTLTPLALISSAFEILNPKTFNIDTTAISERFFTPFTNNLPITLSGVQKTSISSFTAILLVASVAAQILKPLIGKHSQNSQSHPLSEIQHLWTGLAKNIPANFPKFFSNNDQTTDLEEIQIRTTIAYLSALQAKQLQHPKEFEQIAKRITDLEKIHFEKYKMILYCYLYNMKGKASDLYSAEQNFNESIYEATGNFRDWFKEHKISLGNIVRENSNLDEENSKASKRKYA